MKPAPAFQQIKDEVVIPLSPEVAREAEVDWGGRGW